MKRNLLLLALFAFWGLNITLSAQNKDGKKEKEVIRAIWLTYQSWRAESRGYMMPDKYMKEKDTDRIIGQYFISFYAKQKFGKIVLNFDGDKIPGAFLDEGVGYLPVKLTWENERVKKVNIPNLNYCDYTMLYDEKGAIKGCDRGLIGSRKIAVFNDIEFIGDKISKITTYANKNASDKKKTIDFVTAFKYADNEVSIGMEKYEKGKLDKDAKPKVNTYKIINNNTVFVETAMFLGKTTKKWMSYNDSLIVELKTEENGEIEIEKSTYMGNKLFKTESIKTKTDGSFVEKGINIQFSLTDKDESVPNWEKKKGNYKFDSKDELIYESDGSQYRKKENGIWSGWKYFQY